MAEADELAVANTIRNLRDPFVVQDFRLAGIAAESAEQGAQVKVWVRLSVTSDSPIFYDIIQNLAVTIYQELRQQVTLLEIETANSILIVIDADNKARIWINSAAVCVLAIVKREVKAGEPVLSTDFADVIALNFPAVEIRPDDRIIYIFRESWQFAFHCDFNPDQNLSLDTLGRELGRLYRLMQFRQVYHGLASTDKMDRLFKEGWFPFIEILHQARDLIYACGDGGMFSAAETAILSTFNAARCQAILRRWKDNPCLSKRFTLLEESVASFLENRPASTIKIISTELEGIIRDAYKCRKDGKVSTNGLIEYVAEAGKERAGSDDTLFFPSEFSKYLRTFTYAYFDPNDTKASKSRHAIAHGAAGQEHYTPKLALQFLLIVDQVCFYFPFCSEDA